MAISRAQTCRGRGDAPLARVAGRWTSSRGFTVVELLIVVLIVGVLSAMAVMVTKAAVKPTKAESAAARVRSVLQAGREHAIAQRRLVRVTFPTANELRLDEVQLDNTLVMLSSTLLEDRMEFTAFEGQADTPDLFGNTAGVQFTGTAPYSFTSDGMLVDAVGDPANATLTVGMPGDRETVAAVTIMGVTALLRQWRWNGKVWVE